jgi:hypothetical protein
MEASELMDVVNVMHVRDVTAPERAKYEKMWTVPLYFENSPGLDNVDRFIKTMEPKPGSTVIDLGCGAGVAGLELERRGFRVTYLDLVDTALNPEVDRVHFMGAPLWGNWRRPMGWDYGFCCDVLEHIPTEYTMLAIQRIVRSCRVSWLQIALEPDVFGQVIGQPLHLTVQPFDWWRDRIASLGELIVARDLCGVGLYVVVTR